ncbi:MAG: SAM-dependent methyltransferase [Beijerinckiaceae bacterium]
MTPLHRRLIDIIRREGPISVERYMALCLGDPAHGYYMTRDPFGARGDFITSPEVSQMFGDLLGVGAAYAWRAMGAPARFHFVELGPGRGTLSKDALRAMRAMPELIGAAEVHLVETSPMLRDIQRETLADARAPVSWHGDIASLPDGPAIFVANEFFDALPIRQFVRTAEGWRERLVGSNQDDELCFVLAEATSPANDAAPIDALREEADLSRAIVTALASRLAAKDGGAALIIDYGHAAQGSSDTLQAMRAHAFDSPLASPGEADLTVHVDFPALIRDAAAAGAATQGPVTQSAFLRAMGIATRARALGIRATDEQKRDLASGMARLVDESAPTAMGLLFKVIALRAPMLPPLPGFDEVSPSP